MTDESGTTKNLSKVYLVEQCSKHGTEPIGIATTKNEAAKIWRKSRPLEVEDPNNMYIVTEIFLDRTYPDGIGICQHWHIPADLTAFLGEDFNAQINK